jgi:2-keto-3-deoxy-L-rhamnonate aldolase RhmA
LGYIILTESAMRSQYQTDAAAELAGMAPIVRPVGNKPEIIAPFLDRGAWGVQVPTHRGPASPARQRGLSGEVMREAARVR